MPSIAHRLFQQRWPEGEFRLFQMGFVVDDLIGTAERWARVHGIGPFHVLPRMQIHCTYRGAESGLELQIALAQAGPVQIELIEQMCDRPSIYRDLVAKGDSGFHQICTLTRDYDRTKSHYESLGYEMVMGIDSEVARVAHYDTVADFGFFLEVVEETQAFLAQVTQIAETCAAWDGTDPVRLLTADGYRTP